MGQETLLELMQHGKPWLEPELRLADLAVRLQLPSHHLSQILNEGMGMGFNDFINGYRIREAQRLLLDTRYNHFSIEAVGLECGFANKATFNRAFKKITGVTPSAFVEKAGA